eukprot:jgi/Bigna1/78897/fgenesh1_pg.58_\
MRSTLTCPPKKGKQGPDANNGKRCSDLEKAVSAKGGAGASANAFFRSMQIAYICCTWMYTNASNPTKRTMSTSLAFKTYHSQAEGDGSTAHHAEEYERSSGASISGGELVFVTLQGVGRRNYRDAIHVRGTIAQKGNE